MITSQVKQLEKSTVEIEITLPWEDIKQTYDDIVKSVVKDTELSGFRKGKAPKKLVEEKVDKTKIYQEVIKKIIPPAYSQAVSQHHLNPITSPRLDILKAKEGEDWQVKATIVLKPQVNLKNYKNKIRELKKSKVKLWTPKQPKQEENDNKLSLDDIITALADEVSVELSDELVTQEANRMLADLIDQTRNVGLTIEQYLISKGKTNEQLRAEYVQNARKNLTVEFALNEIADQEKITVTQEDIDTLIAKVENEKEKEKLKQDSYYLAHLLRQQKTLDFLKNL